MASSQHTVAALSLAFICVVPQHVFAQAAQSQAPQQEPLGWSETTDLSLVLTAGNSSASTLGFSNKLRHVWSDARSEFEVTTVRAHTSDDRFFLVNPGIEFPVGGAPSNPARGVYSVNNVTATPNADRSVTVQFGGEPDAAPNCIPISPGWNYLVRMYRPRTEILNGTWTFPEAEPV